MFRLAVPKGVHDNRVITYLKNEKELVDHQDFQRESDDQGLVHYTFPGMSEDNFKYIVIQLKNQGVTMIGVDTQLTERKIMKLANLIEELAPTTEEKNKPKWLDALKAFLREWKTKEYRDDKHRAEDYYEDIKGLVEEWESSLEEDIHKGALDKTNSSLAESKLRKLIRRTIRQ